jgi:fructokinase
MAMKYVVALDIGGTKIEGALFNEKFRALRRKRVYLPRETGDPEVHLPRREVLDLVRRLVDELRTKKKIEGVGVCIPNVVAADGSLLGACKIVALSNFPLAVRLKNQLRCDVFVANDADCFALAEALLGAGAGYRNVVGVIYGTGIGSGIVLDGKIYAGSTGSAGEFGHNVAASRGRIDAQGIAGSVESFAGGADLVRNYIDAGGRMKDPDPARIFASREPTARRVRAAAIDALARGLAGLMNVLNPGVFVLGGGQSHMPVYRELTRQTRGYTIPALRRHVKIVKNKLGDDAGVYGAALLALRREVFL